MRERGMIPPAVFNASLYASGALDIVIREKEGSLASETCLLTVNLTACTIISPCTLCTFGPQRRRNIQHPASNVRTKIRLVCMWTLPTGTRPKPPHHFQVDVPLKSSSNMKPESSKRILLLKHNRPDNAGL